MQRIPLSLSRVALFAFLLAMLSGTGCRSRVLYQPTEDWRATPGDIGLPYETVDLETPDRVRISSWWIPAGSPRGVLLFCHGNGGNISDRLDFIRMFNRLGLSTLIFDYRGYGKSEGRPSEQGTYRDAEAAWKYLVEERRTNPSKIIVFGRSLGGAVAARLAELHTLGALILESSFTSVRDVARDRFPWVWVVFPDRYPTKRFLQKAACPVLIIHSRDDRMIPFHHGQDLFAAARGPKEFLEIRGAHNDAFFRSQTLHEETLDNYLSRYLKSSK
jgi:uncharacterized protein